MCFQSVYPSSPETWTHPQQQSWCSQSNTIIARLSLPLRSLWETEMWSAQPLLPLARINQCLQIKSEILVLNCLGALLWRNHWPCSADLETAALRSVCLFFFGCQCHQRLPLAVCSVHWRLSISHRYHTKLFTPAMFGDADSFCNYYFLTWGGRGGTPMS